MIAVNNLKILIKTPRVFHGVFFYNIFHKKYFLRLHLIHNYLQSFGFLLKEIL